MICQATSLSSRGLAHHRIGGPSAAVRRTGPVGVTSTTRLAGSSRVNATAAASSAKQIGSSTVAEAGNPRSTRRTYHGGTGNPAR